MLKTNNLTVQAVVAKYVNSVEDLFRKNGAKRPNEMAVNEMEFYSPHQQLIAKLWFVNSGSPEDHPYLKEIGLFLKFYKENILSEDEFTFLKNNYKEVIEFIFKERKNWSWTPFSLNNLPAELIEVYANLLDMKEGESLYLPFCGYGDVAVKFPQCNMVGYVEDAQIAVFTQIRLAAAGIKAEIFFKGHEDKLLNVDSLHFDAIICSQEDEDILDVYNDADFEHVEKIYNSLAVQSLYRNEVASRILALVNSSFLNTTHKDTYDIRKVLVEDQAIEAVIQLPENLLFDLASYSSIMYINKSSVHDNGILMYNASSATRKIDSKSNMVRLDIDVFNSDFKKSDTKEMNDIIRHISYEEINEYILTPGYYLLKRGFLSGKKLTDLVYFEELRSTECENKKTQYCVQMDSLKSNFSEARMYSLEKSDSQRTRLDHTYKVAPCIFLSATTEDVRVAYSDVKDDNALFCITMFTDILCLGVKEGIPVDYVAALLLTDEVKEQIKVLVSGIISFGGLNPSLLSTVVVPDHNKEQMSDFLEEKLRESMTLKEKELIAERESYERSIRLRKHALTQSVSSFGALFNTLNKCRQRNGGILHDEDIVSPISKKTVAQIFDTLAARMSSIQEKLSKIADIEFDFGDSVNIDPEEFILNYINSKENGWLNFHGETGWDKTQTFNKSKEDYRLPSDGSLVLAKGEPICTFSFPKKALEHIFNNIVSNALAHGFTDEKRNDYKIRFSWETQGMDLIVTVENNGSPLPEGIQPKDILSYGFSTKLNVDGHNGLGGSEIESIMRDYKGKVEVISQPDEEYPVKYKLIFTNTKYTFVHFL